MSSKNKYLVRSICSLVAWVMMLVIFAAIGFDLKAGGVNSDPFKGWDNSITSLDKFKDGISGKEFETSGFYILSLLIFIVPLLYFIYSTIMFAISFKKDSVLNSTVQMIIDVIYSVAFLLIWILAIASWMTFVKDSSSLVKVTCGTKSTISLVLIALFGAGTIAGICAVSFKK